MYRNISTVDVADYVSILANLPVYGTFDTEVYDKFNKLVGITDYFSTVEDYINRYKNGAMYFKLNADDGQDIKDEIHDLVLNRCLKYLKNNIEDLGGLKSINMKYSFSPNRERTDNGYNFVYIDRIKLFNIIFLDAESSDIEDYSFTSDMDKRVLVASRLTRIDDKYFCLIPYRVGERLIYQLLYCVDDNSRYIRSNTVNDLILYLYNNIDLPNKESLDFEPTYTAKLMCIAYQFGIEPKTFIEANIVELNKIFINKFSDMSKGYNLNSLNIVKDIIEKENINIDKMLGEL